MAKIRVPTSIARRAAGSALRPSKARTRPWLDSGFDVTGGHLSDQRDPTGPQFTTAQLRLMARHFIPAVVIETIITHLVEFARPQASPYGIGYRIALREEKRNPSKADEKLIRQAERELYHCGMVPENGNVRGRDKLPTYIRKVAYDSLSLDRAFTEFVPDELGNPAWFQALDGATAYWALHADGKTRYPVQRMLNEFHVSAEWPVDDPEGYFAVLRHRRDRTVLERNGYGVPELEEAWQILWNIDRGVQHNGRYLSHGLTASGIMSFEQGTSRKQMKALRDFIQSCATGAENNRRLLLMTHPKGSAPQFLPFTAATQTDMEFGNWLNFLLKVFCAFLKVDPALINFQFGNEGQTGALTQGSGKDRIQYGREKGIWTLARLLFEDLDTNFVQRRYPDLELKLGGLDTETEEERNARDREALEFEHTNEVRARRDLDELDLENETNPANVPPKLLPTWWQMQQAKMAQPAQGAAAEQGGESGQPGADGGDEQAGQAQTSPQRTIDTIFSDSDNGEVDDGALIKSLIAYARRGIEDGRIVPVEYAA